jgi:hypothetical protein
MNVCYSRMLSDDVLLRLYALAPIDIKLKLIRKHPRLRLACLPLSAEQQSTSIHCRFLDKPSKVCAYKRTPDSAPILSWVTEMYHFKVFLFNRVTLLQMKSAYNGSTKNHLVEQ